MTVPVDPVAPTCDYDGCDEEATIQVRTVLGVKPFCRRHGSVVALIEAEWDRAEAEWLEQA